MLEAIIFDLDGTLWDSSRQITISWNEVFAQKKLKSITSEDVRSVCGMPMDAIPKKLQPENEDPSLLDQMCKAEEDYLSIHGGDVFSGVEELFKYLKPCYKLFIVSNCQDGYIEIFLETSGLGHYIDDYESWGRTRNSKGQNLKDIMKRNGITKAIYVGDTLGDEKAANEASIPFYYTSYGFGQAVDPKAILSEPLALKEYISCP